MDTLQTEKARNSRDKRALELLGSFLSTMTGVPSAHDHRKVLEQIKAIKFENSGLETLMSNLNDQNRELLSRFHTHDTEITQIVTKVNELVNISKQFRKPSAQGLLPHIGKLKSNECILHNQLHHFNGKRYNR